MRRSGLALALLALAGCAHDDWTFRPLVDGADAAPVVSDARVDALREAEVSLADAALDASADAPAEVSGEDAAVDVVDAALPVADVPDAVVLPGLALRAGDFVTAAGAPATVGTLRLVEGGFAWGARVCSDGLCLTGGLQ